MAISNYAILNASNVVINIIVWNGKTRYILDRGTRIIKSETAKIGDVWDEKNFVSPNKGS